MHIVQYLGWGTHGEQQNKGVLRERQTFVRPDDKCVKLINKYFPDPYEKAPRPDSLCAAGGCHVSV